MIQWSQTYFTYSFFQKMFKQFCVDLLIVFIPFTLKYLESVFYMMILETTNVYVDTSNEIVVFLDCKGNYKCGTSHALNLNIYEFTT